MDLGFETKDSIEGLNKVLAETYILYLKTQNYHWNVNGRRFRDLHLMFEEQYTELSAAIDEIAERITALGGEAKGTFKQFIGVSEVEEPEKIPAAEAMVKELQADNELIIRNLKEFVDKIESEDPASADMAIARMEAHSKAAWMLRSSI